MENIYLLDAKRTAIGKFLGSFYRKDAVAVSAEVIRNLLVGVDVNDINMTIVGNVISAGMGQAFFRKISIEAGIPIEKPSYAVNMVCGSGMMAIINAVKEVRCGANLVVAGGVEFMSNIPFSIGADIRSGQKMNGFEIKDLMISDGLTDIFSGKHMGLTAENIAKEFGITREEQDLYSWKTLCKAIEAVDSGAFDDEIVPITLKDAKGNEIVFGKDEYPNRQSTQEKIEKLRPAFLRDTTGTVTAANSSGINDGASFVTIGSEDYVRKSGIEPLAKVSACTTVGCAPETMGLGPYYAISKLLKENELTLQDIDVFEINEAFAAQVLGSVKLLAEEFDTDKKFIMERLNLYGSGLGLGHPLGATGARIVTTLAHIMKQKNYKRGVASLCIGGGQGAAILLERD